MADLRFCLTEELLAARLSALSKVLLRETVQSDISKKAGVFNLFGTTTYQLSDSMICFEIQKDKKTSSMECLEYLHGQYSLFDTRKKSRTKFLQGLSLLIDLNERLTEFTELKNRWARELPFEEAWDVDFQQWGRQIGKDADNIQKKEVQTCKSLSEEDYSHFCELSDKLNQGGITVTQVKDFLREKDCSIEKVIMDIMRKLSRLLSEIETANRHSDVTLFLKLYDSCFQAFKEWKKDELYMVEQNGERLPYDTWETLKTRRKLPAAIRRLMNDITKSMAEDTFLQEVWNDFYNAQTGEIDGEAIGRYISVNRHLILKSAERTNSLIKLFYTVTMIEYLKQRLSELDNVAKAAPDRERREPKGQPSNRVFLTEINGKRLNLAKLIDYIRQHAVDSISYKYEWSAVYLFVLKHGLLQNESLSAFAEQMNMPDWFGGIDGRRKCSFDAISDYNFLSSRHKASWSAKDIIPESSKASRKGVDRITRKYDNLEVDFKLDDFC